MGRESLSGWRTGLNMGSDNELLRKSSSYLEQIVGGLYLLRCCKNSGAFSPDSGVFLEMQKRYVKSSASLYCIDNSNEILFINHYSSRHR